RARGLRLRGSAARLAMYRGDSVLPSPSDDRVGDLSSWFSKLNTLPVAAPVYASGRTLTMRPARLGVRMDSLLLSCRTLSFPIACRFIPALRLPHAILSQ